MRTVKAVLVVCATLGLCACEMAPVSEDSLENDNYVAPVRTSLQQRLADPQMYMDEGNPSMQKMLSNYLAQ